MWQRTAGISDFNAHLRSLLLLQPSQLIQLCCVLAVYIEIKKNRKYFYYNTHIYLNPLHCVSTSYMKLDIFMDHMRVLSDVCIDLTPQVAVIHSCIHR
jgi:hypothetical protein